MADEVMERKNLLDTLPLEVDASLVEIVREMKFASAHSLPCQGYPGEVGTGKCTRLHGHTYVLQVGVKGPLNPPGVRWDDGWRCLNSEAGMVVDFGRIKEFLKWVHDEHMDHWHLNSTLDGYPTAERMLLRLAYEAKVRLEPTLPDEAFVSFLRLYEEYVPPQSYAEIRFTGRGWSPVQ